MQTNRFIIIIILCSFLFSNGSDILSPAEQEKFLLDMSIALEDINNFRVDFKQERHVSILMEPLISQGACYFEKPDHLRWDIQTPYSSILIYNGGQVSKFEIESGNAKKLNFGAADIMSKVFGQIISWMQGDFSASQSLYSIQIVKDSSYRLKLIPKSETMRSNLQIIELFIEPNTFLMQKVVIRESAEDFIRIEFKNKHENRLLPEKLFNLRDPQIFNQN